MDKSTLINRLRRVKQIDVDIIFLDLIFSIGLKSSYVDNNLIQGQVFTIFVITVAAAEAAVGLAILLSLYRNRVTVDMESFNLLKW